MAYTARTIAQIKQQMVDAKNADANLSGLTSNSQTALWNLYFYVVAVCINLFEQLLVAYQNYTLEPLIATVAPNTAAWLQNQLFLFQYSATNPQYVTLVNYRPTYSTVDETLRIITAASVITNSNSTVTIKVAKGNPFQKLSTAELNAVKAYIAQITAAGINPLVLSADADQLYLEGTVYYDAQYTLDVTKTNVQNAVAAYCQNLNIGGNLTGKIENSEIIQAIKNVQGVLDFNPVNIKTRLASDPAGTYPNLLINASTIVNKDYQTYAGYIIPTTDSGNTLADKLTYA